MVRKHRPQAHGPGMQDCLMTEAAQASMAMHYLNLLSYDNIPKYGEEREHSWEGRSSIDDKKWNIVDLETIREISHASTPVVGVRDDDHFVSTINELARKLVDVRFDSSGLGKEEIADHGNIVTRPRGSRSKGVTMGMVLPGRRYRCHRHYEYHSSGRIVIARSQAGGCCRCVGIERRRA